MAAAAQAVQGRNRKETNGLGFIFWALPRVVALDAEITQATKMIIAYMVSQIRGEDGYCNKSVPRIANECGYAERTVWLALSCAVRRGYLEKESDGPNRPAAYFFGPALYESTGNLNTHKEVYLKTSLSASSVPQSPQEGNYLKKKPASRKKDEDDPDQTKPEPPANEPRTLEQLLLSPDVGELTAGAALALNNNAQTLDPHLKYAAKALHAQKRAPAWRLALHLSMVDFYHLGNYAGVSYKLKYLRAMINKPVQRVYIPSGFEDYFRTWIQQHARSEPLLEGIGPYESNDPDCKNCGGTAIDPRQYFDYRGKAREPLPCVVCSVTKPN